MNTSPLHHHYQRRWQREQMDAAFPFLLIGILILISTTAMVYIYAGLR